MLMSFQDGKDEAPIQREATTSHRQPSGEASTHDHERRVSSREDYYYEQNQLAVDALSPRRLLARPIRTNDNNELMGKLTHGESVMKLALSSFKDLSPCDSLSWISTVDDIDFQQEDTTFWGFDAGATSISTSRPYYPEVASLDPQVVDYLSSPSMTTQRSPHARAFASGSVVKAAPRQAAKSRVNDFAPDRKRKRMSAAGDEDPKSIYDSQNFIEDEPTEHDVFLGRGGKANTHIGNFYWLEEKAKLQPLYFEASKGTKKEISQQLVDRIHNKGGRFLQPVKFQDKPPVYRYIEVVDNSALLKKASQTLRETNATDVCKAKQQKHPSPDRAQKR